MNYKKWKWKTQRLLKNLKMQKLEVFLFGYWGLPDT